MKDWIKIQWLCPVGHCQTTTRLKSRHMSVRCHMSNSSKRINYDRLAEQLLAIWDNWKRPELQAKEPNGRMNAITELLATYVGPEAAAGYAGEFITEFSDYDTTYDGASPGEGPNESAEIDRQIYMVKMLRNHLEE
jgi:hypothetical protein